MWVHDLGDGRKGNGFVSVRCLGCRGSRVIVDHNATVSRPPRIACGYVTVPGVARDPSAASGNANTDRLVLVDDFPWDAVDQLFAVADGHGLLGARVADAVAGKLVPSLVACRPKRAAALAARRLRTQQDREAASLASWSQRARRVLQKGMKRVHDELCADGGELDVSGSGSSLCVLLLRGSLLAVAHVGGCRCVMAHEAPRMALAASVSGLSLPPVRNARRKIQRQLRDTLLKKPAEAVLAQRKHRKAALGVGKSGTADDDDEGDTHGLLSFPGWPAIPPEIDRALWYPETSYPDRLDLWTEGARRSAGLGASERFKFVHNVEARDSTPASEKAKRLLEAWKSRKKTPNWKHAIPSRRKKTPPLSPLRVRSRASLSTPSLSLPTRTHTPTFTPHPTISTSTLPPKPPTSSSSSLSLPLMEKKGEEEKVEEVEEHGEEHEEEGWNSARRDGEETGEGEGEEGVGEGDEGEGEEKATAPHPPTTSSSSPSPDSEAEKKEEGVGGDAASAPGAREPVVAVPLTVDHRPDRPDELRRLGAHGGRVERARFGDGSQGSIPRVFRSKGDGPGLPLSRVLGYVDAQEVGVIAEPEVAVMRIGKKDRFLILATDGVWEVLSSAQAVAVAQTAIDGTLQGGSLSHTPPILQTALQGRVISRATVPPLAKVPGPPGLGESGMPTPGIPLVVAADTQPIAGVCGLTQLELPDEAVIHTKSTATMALERLKAREEKERLRLENAKTSKAHISVDLPEEKPWTKDATPTSSKLTPSSTVPFTDERGMRKKKGGKRRKKGRRRRAKKPIPTPPATIPGPDLSERLVDQSVRKSRATAQRLQARAAAEAVAAAAIEGWKVKGRETFRDDISVLVLIFHHASK